MDLKFLERTEGLIERENLEILINSKVAIFGTGGVGSGAVEVLARSGIGEFLLCDYDAVDVTNINRQLIATVNTIGMDKVIVQKERILSINPNAVVNTSKSRLNEDNINTFNLESYDYVVDAIDDVKAKILLIKYCKENGINIISAMGAGKRLDPTRLKIADIYETQGCPLARRMRNRLKKAGVKNLKVVFSDEQAIEKDLGFIPSIAFLPPVSGMIIGGEVIRDLIHIERK